MQNFICRYFLLIGLLGSTYAQTQGKETIVIETAFGNMKLKLFEETPLHKANFLKLVKDKFFDSLMFHRVINNFMIQGGDHLSKFAKAGDSLGHGDIGYSVPAEFNRKIIHKKGRLCAARESDDINPEKASSASQFYIVMGKKRTMEDLAKYEDRINKTYYSNCDRDFKKTTEGKGLKQSYDKLIRENKQDSAMLIKTTIEDRVKSLYLKTPEYKFNQYQIDTYLSVGGTPHLDGTYTVFGELIEGIDVIDKIAAVETDKRNRPIKDIRMKIYIVSQ